MTVPFLDVGAAFRELRAPLTAASQRVLESGWYLFGPELERFEADFAAYCGTRHAVGVGNGLDALHLILRAAGIGGGDEVIVPAHTFIATWLAVTYAGATPVPVECDLATFNIDAAAAAAAVTPRTRAIIPVHLYGQCADMPALQAVATRHGLILLEDAAQAQGARCGDRRAGALGQAAAFSFYPAKNLGAAGDAGAVTTDDAALAERVKRLRNYGAREKYVHELQGFNTRLGELQAAILVEKLRVLDDWNARRRAIAARYTESIAAPGLRLPRVAPGMEPAWHLFVVAHPERDRLAAHLKAHGIETLVHYPTPPHLQPAYGGMGLRAGAFPVAERLAAEVLSLPIGPHLAPAQAVAVAEATRTFA